MLTFNVVLGYQGLLFQGWRMVKSETRRDAEIIVRNPSRRLFGETFRDSKKVKANHEKTRPRDLLKTLPRFRETCQNFPRPTFFEVPFANPYSETSFFCFFFSIRPADPISGNAFDGKRRKKRGWPKFRRHYSVLSHERWSFVCWIEPPLMVNCPHRTFSFSITKFLRKKDIFETAKASNSCIQSCLNPLSPNIRIQILRTELYTFL